VIKIYLNTAICAVHCAVNPVQTRQDTAFNNSIQ